MADDDFIDDWVRGDGGTLVLTLASSTFIAGDRIRLTAKRSRSDADADAVFVKTSVAGEITFTAGQEEATATIAAADTEGLPAVERGVTLFCDWQITNVADVPKTADRFRMRVVPDSSVTVP